MEEKDYNKLFGLMVKKFNLWKRQSTTDVFIKKGEVSAINKIIGVLEAQIKAVYIEKQRKLKSYKDDETSMKKFKINEFGPKSCEDVYSVLQYFKLNLSKEQNNMNEITALEKLFEILDSNIEDSLREMDLYKIIEDNKSNVSKDIEIRMSTGKCALKRPGRVKFPCDEELVPGQKYCKEHLKQFNPEVYFNLFEEK